MNKHTNQSTNYLLAKLSEKFILRKIMTYIFLILLTFFTISIWIFAYRNDFDFTLLELMYSAVGATLLSSYLIIKSVYIDHEDNIVKKIPVLILKDISNGNYYSLINNHMSLMPEDRDLLNGLKNFGSIHIFQNKVNWEKPEFKNFKSKVESEKNKIGPDYILEDLEATILRWLQYDSPRINSLPVEKYYFGSGSIGSSATNEDPNNFKNIQIPIASNDDLLKLYNQKDLFLRKKASIKRESKNLSEDDSQPNIRKILIDNVYSSITISIAFRGMNRPSRFSEDDLRIAKMLNTSVMTLEKMEYNLIEVIWEFELKKSRKFSWKMRNDKKWFQRLVKSFENDYSWNVLREYYRRIVSLP